MAQITIGGAPISASLSVFTRLKRAWKYIEQATKGDLDFVTAMDAIIGVVAVGLDAPLEGEPAVAGPVHTVVDGVITAPGVAVTQDDVEAFRIQWISDHMTGQEIKALRPFMNQLMVDAGLAEPAGE